MEIHHLRFREIGWVMYAKFGCCKMLPNSVFSFPNWSTNSHFRQRPPWRWRSSVIPCHGVIGDGCRELNRELYKLWNSVYSRIWKLPVIFFLQLPMYVRRTAMRGAPQCAARSSLIVTTLAKLSKQLRNITYRQLFNKHTILSCLFLKMVVYCNKQLCK